MNGSVKLLALVLGFTIASGVCDSLAFTHAARMWKDGRLVWVEMAKSGASFLLGIATYWAAVRYLSEAGVVLAEIQTLLWFVITFVGVSILGGRFFHWQPTEQLVGVSVLVGLGWLITRTAT